MSLIKREPVAFFGGLQAVLLAVLTLLSVFNVFVPTDAQLQAIVGVYVAITLLVTFLIRGAVTPTTTAD